VNPRILAALASVAGVVAARQVGSRLGGMDLQGRVVLITGASRGLGFALAEEFTRRGARLVICGRDAEHLAGAKDELVRQGAEVVAQPCDVSDPEQVDRLLVTAREAYGGVDVIVNNAGVIAVGPAQHQRLDDYHEQMGVMFWGVLHTTLAALPDMVARGEGRVVNITSIGGKISVPHLLPYSCAKSAAAAFSEGLHAELSGTGVRVTTVVPGLMRTGSHRNAWFKGRREAEYTWFALLAASPVTAMNPRRAARRIVNATARGEAEVLLGVKTHLAVRFHGLFPGTTIRLLRLVGRLLPRPGGAGEEPAPGHELERPLTMSPLTAAGRRSAAELREDPRVTDTRRPKA
jgi:short-subunit dehydrogenase